MIAATYTSWGPVSVLELAWTLMGLAGAWYASRNLRDARRYLAALRKVNGNRLPTHDAMAAIAFGHYRNEVLRALVFAVIVIIGVVAMVSPPTVKHAPITTVSVVVTAGLLVIVLLEVAKSALDARQRELIRSMLES